MRWFLVALVGCFLAGGLAGFLLAPHALDYAQARYDVQRLTAERDAEHEKYLEMGAVAAQYYLACGGE